MDVPPSKKDIYFTSLLVSFVGLVVWGLFFSAFQGDDESFSTEPSREPSSALVGAPTSKEAAFRNGELQLDCLFEGKPHHSKTASTAIKLKGKWCGEEGSSPVDLKRVFVKNVSNGFSGTFFALPGNAFVTDLIALKEGDNQISIEAWSEDDHHFKTTVQIQREL